jgi:hypothetical protein
MMLSGSRLAIAVTAIASHLTEYAGSVAKLTRRTIGELNITSGEVLACDPLGDLQEEVFAERFPLGTYPVILCVAELPNGLHISAYAMVEFMKTQPATWDIAHVRNSQHALMPDHYWVASGTGCFMDVESRALLATRFTPDDPEDPYRMWLVQLIFGEEAQSEVGIADVRLADPSGKNCIIFETGWGDDWYTSYVGRDLSGTVCCLLTEFGVLDLEQAVEV